MYKYFNFNYTRKKKIAIINLLKKKLKNHYLIRKVVFINQKISLEINIIKILKIIKRKKIYQNVNLFAIAMVY